MSLKLKLNLGGNKDLKKNGDQPTPVIKFKPSTLKTEDTGSVHKPKPPKEVKKLKISLGRAAQAVAAAESAAPSPKPAPPPKSVPKLRIKPTRIPGEGYDSEAPDVEDDPLIEHGIAIRFVNDANLDFVQSAVDTGDFSNLNIKWITRDKAVVNVNLTLYLARLIDLPTLTEIYKTVDKKNIFKTIDISQILLVLRTINPKLLNMEKAFEVPEEYTYTHPLYTLSVNNEIKATKTVFRDGLLSSLEDVYRRFRPRKTNHRLMTDIELRVDDLVRRDNDAEESHYEYVNPKKQAHKFTNGTDRPALNSTMLRPDFNAMLVDSRPPAEDQTDGEEQEEEDQQAHNLEADYDNVLERELIDVLDSTSNTTAATVLMQSKFGNEEGEADADDGHADDDDDDEDDDDDNDDDDDDEDDATKEDNSRAKKLEEEIVELQKATEKQKHLLATASYKMMRMKFQSNYNHLKTQLDQKKRELSKVREQQQKQANLTKPQHKPTIPNPEEEEEEEEEEDDEEEEEPERDDQPETLQQDFAPEALEAITENNSNDVDDFDDFQGLF